jgi:acyl-CoA oxidase
MNFERALNSSPMHPLLKRDRMKASFDVRNMTLLLDGSTFRTALKERMAALVFNDPVHSTENVPYLSREELVEMAWRRRAHAIRKIRDLNLNDEEAYWYIYYVNVFSGFSSTHESMFIPTLANQTSESQFQKWYPLAKNYQIIGTYAQVLDFIPK